MSFKWNLFGILRLESCSEGHIVVLRLKDRIEDLVNMGAVLEQ